MRPSISASTRAAPECSQGAALDFFGALLDLLFAMYRLQDIGASELPVSKLMDLNLFLQHGACAFRSPELRLTQPMEDNDS